MQDELDAADRARLIEKTKAMGLYGLDIPPAFGGPDIDLVTRTLMAVEMAQHRAGTVRALLWHLWWRGFGPAL
jgi:acyl-CoA dehydrogenase